MRFLKKRISSRTTGSGHLGSLGDTRNIGEHHKASFRMYLYDGFKKISNDLQIIIKVFGLIKYFLSNKILTSPILTLDAN